MSRESGAARSVTRVMAAIFGSRILGLVREVVLNAVFGPGRELDAFLAAFRIPNLLRDLFAEGALSTAFVTTFSKKLQREGKAPAFRLANLVLSALLAVLAVVTLLGMVFSHQLVDLIAAGFTGDKADLTADLTRILFPFIALVSLAAVYMGLLNSLGSFGLPASASMAFNVVSIAAGLALGWCFDPGLGPRAIYGFAFGTVLGGAAQLFIQLPKARSLGYRPRWEFNLRDPGLREVLVLMGPAVVGGAAVQVNVLVNTWFASYLGHGAVTWLNNAFRLMQLPIGMFGVAIATVTLPHVSRSAAGADMEAFRGRLRESLRFACFLTLPAAAGLVLLAEPVIGFIYQELPGLFMRHVAFTNADTAQTALVLRAYAIGLAAYACIKVIAPAFYAIDLPGIPLRVSLAGIVLNIVFNLLFVRVLGLGLAGLPLSTSLVALVNLAQLTVAMRGRIGRVGGPDFAKALLKVLLASALMSGAVAAAHHGLAPLMRGAAGGGAGLLALVLGGCAVYFGLAWALGIEEARRLGAVIRGWTARRGGG